jgi:predicted enzyme related to lactoylglutathione lyase
MKNTESNFGVGDILATNAFFYYKRLENAWCFYRDILGFQTVADYGFAKIMRVAQTSFVTLVDSDSGMHNAQEPKSVTLAMVTEQVTAWYDYLVASGIPMHRKLEIRAGSPHDGFVTIDPEGYFLEFECFNSHQENISLLPLLSSLDTTYAAPGNRPQELGVKATVLWLYYHDLSSAQQFHEGLLGVEPLVDQGWAKVYPISSSGFIGFVDGEHGLHKPTKQKCVTVSFITDNVDSWFQRAAGWNDFDLLTPKITHESERVRLFVSTDPEGYYFEWDTFLIHNDNADLLRQLRKCRI